MPNLLHMPSRVRLVQRVERLRPDAIRLWGEMPDAHAMLCHLHTALALAFGEIRMHVQDSWLNSWYGRLLIIDAPLPWPRGKVKAPAELLPASAHDWEWDRNRVVEYVQRFSVGPHQSWGVHPAFGKLSPRRWGRLSWRHCDHHLCQFGT